MINLTPTSHTKYLPSINFIDFILIAVSPFIALGLRGREYLDFGDLPLHPSSTLLYAISTILITFFIYLSFRLNQGLLHLFSAHDFLLIVMASFSTLIASVFSVFLLSRLEGVPRSVPFTHSVILLFGLLLYRLIIKNIYFYNHGFSDYRYQTGEYKNQKRIMIIGLDPFALAAIRLIEYQRPKTMHVVGCFSVTGKNAGRKILDIQIYSDLSKLGETIDEYSIHGVNTDELWISDSSSFINDEVVDYVKLQAESRNIICKTISSAFNLPEFKNQTNDYREQSIVPFKSPIFYFRIKRCLDLLISILLLFCTLPILLLLIAATLFEVGMPVFFWQERIGQFGVPFKFYKIRTMKSTIRSNGSFLTDCERVSKVTFLIRRSRLDEIPQLFSIIAGDMSGIGPRPLLSKDQPLHKHIRLLVRPGITGWAQVNGADLLSKEEKDALDTYYVYNMSLFLDAIIVFKTVHLFLFGIKRNENNIQLAKLWIKQQNFFRELS
jgi:lipopolysaccharide/colanic/teichoic acid biosynthesis glycosyltransferase